MTSKVKTRRRGVTTVSSKNQITLPVSALAQAHLGPGDRVRVEVIQDGVLRLVRDDDPLAALIGAIPGISAAADLEAMRDEWQR